MVRIVGNPIICIKAVRVLFVFFILTIHWFQIIKAQNNDPLITLSETLKSNVVALKSSSTDGLQEKGFGFITGESGVRLYVVTALHVVKDQISNTLFQNISVKLFGQITWQSGFLLKTWEEEDLALLEIIKPKNFKWLPNCAALVPRIYEKVRFIGINGSEPSWSSPGNGEIFEVSTSQIKFVIGTIKPGTSGAPLITERGIAGLITEDEGISSFALSISKIKALLLQTNLTNVFALQPANGSLSSNSLYLFKHDNLNFEITQCRKAGQYIECQLKITNNGRADEELYLYGNEKTRAIASGTGYEYFASGLRMADKTNSEQVVKTLVPDNSIVALVTFNNVFEQVQDASKIELSCWSSHSGYFKVEFRNVSIK